MCFRTFHSEECERNENESKKRELNKTKKHYPHFISILKNHTMSQRCRTHSGKGGSLTCRQRTAIRTSHVRTHAPSARCAASTIILSAFLRVSIAFSLSWLALSQQDIISCHIMVRHIISISILCHIMSSHIISCYVISCDVLVAVWWHPNTAMEDSYPKHSSNSNSDSDTKFP